jgi:class 3 adenylate cyclase/DNA-binding SARP family transcriptional activator/tetratricopeptide (TPR) repeat protein
VTLGGTVTLLFTDLVGSTQMLERLGQDAAERISREHFGLLRHALEQHGGAEVKALGDGLMAVFPSALAAVESAVDMQCAVAAAEIDEPLEVRIGLHAGEPIAADDDFYGRAVVVASRLCDSANGGEVRASRVVRDLVGERPGLSFRDIGALELHGLAQPVDACAIEFERPAGPTRISLCGPLVVEIDGQRADRALRGRQALLVAYMALHRHRPVRRDELIAALWGDAPPAAPEAALRTLLARVRAAVGPGVVEGGSELRLELPDRAQVDVEVARVAVDRAADSEPRAAIEAARSAVTIADRTLLPGYEADWVDEHRRELDGVRLAALEHLARAGLEIGGVELTAAERAARAVIEAEPYRESGYALLMEVHAANGNVAEALRVYDLLRVLLREELGVSPAAPLRELNERLLTGEPSARAAADAPATDSIPLPAPLASPESRRFVGRGGCSEDLRRLWERAKVGHRRVVAIAGEPGIGKTRLLREFAREAHTSGATVLFGRSDEEAIRPYQPFVDALRHAVAHADRATLAAMRPNEAGEVARLVPELLDRRDDMTELPPADPDAARFLLFDGIVALVGALAREHPVLIALDDLQWADRPTLLLLRHVAHASAGMPVLMVATVRSTEMEPLAGTLAELRHEESLEELTLDGLSSAHVGAMIAEQTEGQAEAEFVEAVHQETGGNPFFVGEVVRHVAEAGATVVDSDELERLGVPRGVKEVIGRRVNRLSEHAREALKVAAVIGHSFRSEVVEAVAGEPVIEALEEAEAIHLVIESTDDVGQFSFTHALVRATLWDDLTPTRRARVHRRVGEAIEQVYARDLGTHLPALAYHFNEGVAGGGDAGKAIDYNLRAARRAGGLVAYEEAAEHLTRALQRMAGQAADAKRRQCQTLLDLGDARWNAGELDAARDSYDRAAVIAEQIGAPEDLARAAIGYAGRAGEDWGEAPPRKIDLLERALAALPDGMDALRARLESQLARALLFSEARDRIEQLSRDALESARRSGDDQALGEALVARHWAVWNPGHVNECLGLADELVACAERAGDMDLMQNGLADRVVAYAELGRREELDEAVEQHARLAREQRKPFFQMFTEAERSTLELMAGRVDDAAAALERSYEFGQSISVGAASMQLYGLQTMALRFERGDLDDIVEPLAAIVAQFPAIPGWRAALARVLATMGRRDEAAAHLGQLADEGFDAIPFDGNWMMAMALAAEACVLVDDPATAAPIYDQLAPYADRTVNSGWLSAWFGPVAFHLGQLASTMESWDDAVAHLDSAIETSERMRAAPWTARARAGAAVAHAGRGGDGDLDRAAELLELAGATADELGLAPLRAEVDAARDSVRRVRPPRAPLPASRSDRA